MKTFIVVLFFVLTGCSDLDYQARRIAESAQLDMSTPLDHSSDPAGPDLDKNGIRDDIDLWISKQKFTKDQVRAVNQYARVSQQIMAVKFKNRKEARVVQEKSIRALDCIDFAFNDISVSKILNQSIANTRARIQKEDKFGSMINGMSFSFYPQSMLKKEDVCD